MSTTKVPTDPNLTPEMRRFLDDVARSEGRLREYVDEQIAANEFDYAVDADAETGTSEELVMNPAVTVTAIRAWAPFSNFIFHARDEKANGTDAGTFSNGAWRTRTINTVKTNTITGASLSSNEVTLPAGRYWVQASAPASDVNAHVLRLFDVTPGNTTIMFGQTARTPVSTGGQTHAFVSGEMTLSASTAVRLEHFCSSTQGTTGFGRATSLGSATEVFADIVIWKLD
jgi:hypothetical protein